jgi:FPC/CPF motif-containing protein YcgG
MLKQQYAGSLTQSSVRATFADSLSQYSKHSDDMGGHGTEVEVRSTN